MRVDGINKIEAKTKKIVVDKDNVSQLIMMGNRRDIRSGKVRKLYQILEHGKHFETPIVTSIRESVERVLDGNHRVEAISKYLLKHPERKVELWVFYYENLNCEEEKQKYTTWNLGTKQTTNDFVQQYWDEIPILKMFGKNPTFTVSHKWQSHAIEFKTLMSVYLTRNEKKFQGGFGGSAMDFIEECKKLGNADFLVVKNFLDEFMSIFGAVDRDNYHYKQAVFFAIQRIWLDNYKYKNPAEMRKYLKRLVMNTTVIYYQKLGGTRENTTRCRDEFLKDLNKHRTKELFI